MKVRFWGTRGSLAVAQKAAAIRDKITAALVAASGRSFAGAAEARAFAETELDFATFGTYGGATSCVEIEAASPGSDGEQDAFIICDLGSGLREFGLDAMGRCAKGHARVYHVFLSHLHWDHICGFPFFVPVFDPNAEVVIHSGHPDAETALIEQGDEARITYCIERLAKTDASMIRTAFYEGTTYADLAGRSNLPLGTVKSRIRRALLKLRECLA